MTKQQNRAGGASYVIPDGWRRIAPGSREKIGDRFRFTSDGGHRLISEWERISCKGMCQTRSFAHWIVIRRLSRRKKGGSK